MGFQKYQTKVANVAPRLSGPTAECFQLQGASPPKPLTRDSADVCDALPLDPAGGSDPRPPLWARSPHCFRPGDAPDCLHAIFMGWKHAPTVGA